MTGDWDDGVSTTFNGKMQNCRWSDGLLGGATARIYSSTFLGTVDLNGSTAGIAGSYIKGVVSNATNASFNFNNLLDTDVE